MRKSLGDRLAEAIGTGFWSGHFPIFPGTVGSIVGLVIYVVLLRLGVLSEAFSVGWLLTLGVGFTIGVPAADRCEKLFEHDSKRIVVDEIWGMLIALFMLPTRWPWVLGAFLIFRAFDVVKPFPARGAERIGGGLAVMLDDGVAGAYTALVLHGLKALLG